MSEESFHSEHSVQQTRYPRNAKAKAKKIKLQESMDYDESYDSHEDEDMYHEDWIEPQHDFEMKHFEGIPNEWHQTIKVKNPHT